MVYRVFISFPVSTGFQLAPTGSPSLVNSMKVIQNPVKTCDMVYTLIQSLTSQIRKRLEDPKSAGSVNLQVLCTGKTFQLHLEKRISESFLLNITYAEMVKMF